MDLSRYAELFRSEAAEHLVAIENALSILRDEALDADSREECIGELFRSTHTIKGMAAAMGYSGVEQLAHALESVLDTVRNGSRVADANLLATLTNGADVLAGAVDRAVEEARGASDASATAADGVSTVPDAKGAAVAQTSGTERTGQSGGDNRVERARRNINDSTVRVDTEKLDSLLNLAGELVLVRDRLRGASEHNTRGDVQSDMRELKAHVHDTAALISALQEEVLRLRLVPVHTMFDRFPRLVRELARKEGKEVAFVTEGRDIEVDRSLIEVLGDPVVHMLRNAVDHGLESPDARSAAGKPPTGRLTLRAVRDRSHILMEIEDDGRGIDRDAVLERARQRGLVEPGKEVLSDEELLDLISLPGLSTAAAVTSVSGRGVGIDVVVHKVRGLGGTISLDTAHGRGTRFTLRLPATLAITRALLVSTGGSAFAFPAANVLEVHALEDVAGSSDGSVRIRDDVMPFIELNDRYMLPSIAIGDRHVVVVDSGAGKRALFVDQITGHQDIVVKRFHPVRGAKRWFSGATLLGDGRPALIVDVRSLA